MNKTKLNEFSATQLMRLMEDKQCSPQEIVSDCFDQIERIDGKINAWIYKNRDLAMSFAKSVARRLSKECGGKLAGIPIGVKDIFNTKDMPTQMGSAIWKDFNPGNDARVVHNIRMADGIIMGKTVTAEFAVHTPGSTCNPFDSNCMAGTSSTGSAVAVACRMVPLALGTQTAGSIIRPASYNGVFGFKPSFGLVPRTAMLKTTDSLDTVGVFSRSIEDLGLIFEVLRVHGTNYPIVHREMNKIERQNVTERPWKVAVVRGPKWNDAESYAQEALLDFANRLESISGVEIIDKTLPTSVDAAHEIHATIYNCSLAYYFKEEYKLHKLVSPIMCEIIEQGSKVKLDQLKYALNAQHMLVNEMDSFFREGCDIILDLSTGGEALEGRNSVDRPDNCLIWTLCGLSVVNMPVFMGPNKLPFGLQVIGRKYDDYKVLNFLRFVDEHGLCGKVPLPNIF